MAEEATTLSELEVLVELQELDTRLSQLTHRAATLPEREELIRIQEQIPNLNRFESVSWSIDGVAKESK